MEIVYKNRDNKFAKVLTENGTPLTAEQMGAITKIELLFLGRYYASDTHTSAFDKTTRASEGVIVFDLGSIADIDAGRDKAAELIIYSADYPDGLVWTTLDIKVIELQGV